MNKLFSEKNRNQFIVLGFILLIFTVITSSIAYHGTLEWDEGSFLQNSEYFLGDKTNFEESRPATISYLVAILWFFTGESTLFARFLTILFGLISVILFYIIVRKEFDEPYSLTAVFAFSPLMLYWSSHVYTDVFALVFLLGSYHFYQKRKYLYTGILLSIAATIRYVFLIFAIAAGIAFIIEKRHQISELIMGGVIGALPFLLYSKLYYQGFFSRIKMYLFRVSKWSDSGLFASVIPGVQSAIYSFSIFIPAMIPGLKKTNIFEKTLIVAYSIFVIFISGNSYTRYWLAILPFMIMIVARGNTKKIFYVISIIMILISGISVADTALTKERCQKPLSQALEYSQNLNGVIISDSWAITGYKLDQPVISPWKSIDSLITQENAEYAILDREIPYKVIKSFSNNCKTYYIYNLNQPIG